MALIDDEQPVEGEIFELTDDERAAMERAAEFCRTRKYFENSAALVMYMAQQAIETEDLNLVILEQMAVRLASASNHEDVLDPFGTLKGANLVDKPLWIVGATFLETDQAEGFPYYASLEWQDRETGSGKVVTVGGEKLMFKIAALHRAGMFPCAMKITQTPSKKHPGQVINDLVMPQR